MRHPTSERRSGMALWRKLFGKTRLFKVYSTAPSFISLLGALRAVDVNLDQECIIHWVCWKERPVAYHERFVAHYERLNEDDKHDAKRYVDEKFTEEEARLVKEVLENKYKVEVHVEEISQPICDEWRTDGTHDLLHSNHPGLGLGEEVPFDVHGYIVPKTVANQECEENSR
jgi:hypothetical protein